MENFEEHDGFITNKDPEGNVINRGINSSSVIKEESDPRKCFLLGQLHIEYYCDSIILGYFSNKDRNKEESLENFIKSKFMSFNDKIELLKLLEGKEGELIVDKDIINSLIVVAEIRNAFQHNLGREDAVSSLKKNRRRMPTKDNNKKLNEYSDAIDLMNDFKSFFEIFYPKLIVLWIKVSLKESDRKEFLKRILDANKKKD
jgi:hypothetical protein